MDSVCEPAQMPASASTPSGAYADVWHPKSRVGTRPSRLTGTTACSPGCKDEGVRRADRDRRL
eukprot:15230661-Alexandrium_andersonii.AAC.1